MNTSINIENIENPRILIVDDNESAHKDLKKILLEEYSEKEKELNSTQKVLLDHKEKSNNHTGNFKIHYQIDDAYQGEEAILMVKKAEASGLQYAVIFMDIRMPPGINGIEAIEKIWEVNPFIEFVICTSFSDYTWEEIICQVGTSEHLLFLKKPFNKAEVKQLTISLIFKWNMNEKVRRIIKTMENEIEERIKQVQLISKELNTSYSEYNTRHNEIMFSSDRDITTKLYSLEMIHTRLQEIIESSRRHNYPVSIIIIDILNLKDINEKYGHDAGNEALIKVAEILKGSPGLSPHPYREKQRIGEIRKYDVAGRYGSSELVIILPYCEEEQAKKVASRLMKRITNASLSLSKDFTLEIDMGISVLNTGIPCKNSDEFLSFAEKALYYAKSQGKNKMHIISFE